MDDEREDATEEVEVREAERERKLQRSNYLAHSASIR